MSNVAVKSINVPTIISANTFLWSPSSAASSRRSNEARRRAEIESFLIEFELHKENGCFTHGTVEVRFCYSESCKNVYKSFEVFRAGKKSNIKGLAAELRKTGIELV